MLGVLILRRLDKHALSVSSYALMAGSLFFAFTFAWRDSLVLNLLSILALIVSIILGFTLKTQKKLRTIYATELINDLSESIRYGLTSYHQLLKKDVQWHEVQRVKRRYGRSVSRGLLLTMPLFSVFMVLLIASDARFEQLVYALFDWGWALPEIVRYNMVFIVISLFVAAILRVSVLNEGIKDCQICEKLPYWSLGKIEIVMLLGTLNVLFFGFIAVQFSYFFGGDALVQSLDGLTYAKYARRGFFQLVTVAILVIVLLLFSHWSYKSATDSDSKVFTYLAAIMLLLTMTIELSAAHRMSLYTSVYGLTELRFYTSNFLA